jgi:hypothetical protein
MASYAVIQHNAVASGREGIVGIVVTDGKHTVVVSTPDDPCGLHDVEWDTGPEADVLRAGLTNLYYFTVDGPHTFEGSAYDSIDPLAKSYGLA